MYVAHAFKPCSNRITDTFETKLQHNALIRSNQIHVQVALILVQYCVWLRHVSLHRALPKLLPSTKLHWLTAPPCTAPVRPPAILSFNNPGSPHSQKNYHLNPKMRLSNTYQSVSRYFLYICTWFMNNAYTLQLYSNILFENRYWCLINCCWYNPNM